MSTNILDESSPTTATAVRACQRVRDAHVASQPPPGVETDVAKIRALSDFLEQEEAFKGLWLDSLHHGFMLPPREAESEIVIIGAGVAGLAIANMLIASAHRSGIRLKVYMLEGAAKPGGRLSTEKFSRGLHAERGGMRIPGSGQHFLTDAMVERYKLPIIPFKNECEYTFHYFERFAGVSEPHRGANKEFLDAHFPGWSDGLPAGVENLDDLLGATVGPVVKELETMKWVDWVARWSVVSAEDFLLGEGPQCSGRLPPWSRTAVYALKTIYYMPFVDMDLVEFLRDPLGKWWKDPMYTLRDGMEALPIAMLKDVEKRGVRVRFGCRVTDIDTSGVRSRVTFREGSKTKFIDADHVFCTVAFAALKKITFNPPMEPLKQEAVANVHTNNSAKALIPCKHPFWQELLIDGGLSQTDTFLGQIRYPTTLGQATDETPVPPTPMVTTH